MSAPLASTATTTSLTGAEPPLTRGSVVIVLVVVRLGGHHLATGIGPAYRAHTVRPARTVAARALVQSRRGDPVVGAAQGRAAVRLLFLGDRHRRHRLPGLVDLQLTQLCPARVGRPLVHVLGSSLVEVHSANGTQPGAVLATQHPIGQRQGEGVARPRRQIEPLVLQIGARAASSPPPGRSTSRASTSI